VIPRFSKPTTDPPTARCVHRALAWLVAILAVAALLATGARTAEAHAFLDRSDPPANAVVAIAPARVTMWFTEPIEHASSSAELYDQSGNIVRGTSYAFDPTDKTAMVLTLPSGLPNGTYSVVFRNVSAADGHPVQGYLAFTVGTGGAGAAYVPQATGPTGAPAWLVTVSRWVPLVGLALLVAAWPVWLLVLRTAISPAWQAGPALVRRVRRLVLVGIAVSLGGDLLALVVQADNVRDGSSLAHALRTTLFDSRYGRLWVARVALVLVYAAVLAGCAWWWPRRRKAMAALALVVAAALPLPFSLISHASAQQTGRTVAIAVDWFHLLGAAVWAGGLLALVGALLPTLRDLTPAGRRVVLARGVPRFSAVALTAWGVVGATGLYNAWLQVGNLTGLFHTAYGHTLIAKLALLVPILVLAAFNLLVVGRRLKAGAAGDGAVWVRRFAVAVGAEAVLVVLVLLVVGRLTSQAPARETLAQQAGALTRTLDLQGHSATLAISPGATGPNHYVLTVSGPTLPDKTEAVLRLTVPTVNAGQKEVDLVRAAGNDFEAHGSELSIAGDWQIQAIVRNIGQFEYQATTTLAVGTTPPTNGVPGDAWHFGTEGGIAGLLLVVAGIAALALAWAAGRSPLRKESGGLGVVAIALGAILLLQSRGSAATAVALTAKDPVPADARSVTRGSQVFAANCAVCHGATGRGNGPAAGSLTPATPPPADFTSAHARSHYDGEFFNWIKYGKLHTAMPAFGDKLSDQDIWDVINYLRVEFQGAPGGTPAAGASPTASASPGPTPTP
jgi:copper transport protein